MLGHVLLPVEMYAVPCCVCHVQQRCYDDIAAAVGTVGAALTSAVTP